MRTSSNSGKEMLSSTSAAGLAPADEWSDIAVSTLLDCYNDKYMELNGGSIGTKGWQDVIFKLNSVCAQGRPVYSYRRCKNKLDVMKRRFKIERDRKATNGGVSDWPWFQKMEEIVGRNPRLAAPAAAAGSLVIANGNGNDSHFQQQQLPAEMSEVGVLDPTIAAASTMLNHAAKRERLASSSFNNHNSATTVAALGHHQQHQNQNQHQHQHHEEISAAQFLSDQQEDDDDEDNFDCQRRPPAHSTAAATAAAAGSCKKRKKNNMGCSNNPLRHAKEIARIVTEALERMETKRLEVMKELELKRNETQLQIARMIIESNNRMQQQQQQQQQHHTQARPPSSSSEPQSYVDQHLHSHHHHHHQQQ